MKQFSLFEKFIEQVGLRNSNLRNGVKKTLGSFLIVTSLVGLSGGMITHAQAPSETDIVLQNNGFSSDADRAVALEKLAAEIKQLAYEKEQQLWLARILYSETKRSEEMPYIAWVVRNRVELCHRSYSAESGKCDYKGAALATSQFSGMHPHLDHNAYKNLAMDYSVVGVPAWDEAVRIAKQVYYSDGSDRVLNQYVTHFYSPIVIAPPAWAVRGTEVYRFPTNRFAFYSM